MPSSRNSKRIESNVWQFFSRKNWSEYAKCATCLICIENGVKETNCTFKCTQGSTSPLIRHLKLKHIEIYNRSKEQHHGNNSKIIEMQEKIINTNENHVENYMQIENQILQYDWSRNLNTKTGFWGDTYWYDAQIKRRMPLVSLMLDELVYALPPCNKASVADFCSGSGAASLKLLGAYPQAIVTLIDSSQDRLLLAKKKFLDQNINLDNLSFVCERMDSTWNTLPHEPYDLIIASLALHVLVEKPKHYNNENAEDSNSVSVHDSYLNIFKLLYASLKPGGHLIVADHIRVLPLFQQLLIMQHTGFSSVDCSWRKEDYVVFGGRKPIEDARLYI